MTPRQSNINITVTPRQSNINITLTRVTVILVPRLLLFTYHSKVDFIVSRGSLSKVDSAPVDPSVTVPYILQEEAQDGGVFRQKEGGPAGQAGVDPVLGRSRASHVIAKQTKL